MVRLGNLPSINHHLEEEHEEGTGPSRQGGLRDHQGPEQDRDKERLAA